MKGRKQINASFLKDMAKAYDRLRSIKDVIINDWDCEHDWTISIAHGIHFILIVQFNLNSNYLKFLNC